MVQLPDSTGQRQQLAEQRRRVDFDTYDVTVDELLRRVGDERIDIAPEYQRRFRWDRTRQSRLVESVLLGIPVPPLFMATNKAEGQKDTWEVVDGLQRLMTLVNFAGTDTVRNATELALPPLTLEGLEKLSEFNGCTFLELSEDLQSALTDRPLKVVVLNDKSQLQVRYDLFERLNTGGLPLTPQEIRECVFRGPFMELLTELSELNTFKAVVLLPEARQQDGTPQDYALRFFAFLERYTAFQHSVDMFLRDFTISAVTEPNVDRRRTVFVRTFDFLQGAFPEGLRGRKNTTPVNLFEGVAVGAALALGQRPELQVPTGTAWVRSDELRRLTTGATNSRPRVSGRIEYCRDQFLLG